MKPRLIVLALLAALGSGCASIDQPRQAMDIEPLLAVRHGAPDAQSYYQLGRYYQGQHRLAQAEEAYLKAIAVDQRNLNAYDALGRLYAERGDLERSAKMFERATSIAPNTAYLYNNLGFAYYLRGRLDAAYSAVRKALSLDSSLARGWANLEKIAASRPDAALLTAVKARRLNSLPTEFASATTEAPPTAPLAAAQAPADRAEGDLAAPSATDERPVSDQPKTKEELIAGNRFVLVSASREAIENDGVILITSTVSGNPAPQATPVSRPRARIEVANANGVSRFATHFSTKLRSEDIPVARITNFGSSQLKQTVVEYQPGYEDAARELVGRTQLAIRIIPAVRPRSGSDIRIVLGRDALKFGEQTAGSLADNTDQQPRRRLAS